MFQPFGRAQHGTWRETCDIRPYSPWMSRMFVSSKRCRRTKAKSKRARLRVGSVQPGGIKCGPHTKTNEKKEKNACHEQLSCQQSVAAETTAARTAATTAASVEVCFRVVHCNIKFLKIRKIEKRIEKKRIANRSK